MLADITYCSTWDGWLYVAFILDVYARVIVGWQIANHMRTDPVLDALEMAAWRRAPIDGCVHHSDAGSPVHLDPLHRPPRRRRPGSLERHHRRLPDNAMAEELNGTYKAELIGLHGPWRNRRQLEIGIVEWIDWYNHRRLHLVSGTACRVG